MRENLQNFEGEFKNKSDFHLGSERKSEEFT